MNQNFQFFVAMNTPFAASSVHLAPLSDLDDGYNDIISLRGQHGGKIRMARLLLNLDDGTFFQENGEVRQNLPIDYIKVSEWELRPRVKANTIIKKVAADITSTSSRAGRLAIGICRR